MISSNWFDVLKAEQDRTFKSLAEGKCGCHLCIRDRGEIAAHMVVCRTCGNKRCPHANNHSFACTNSNKRGQKGSAYE